MAQCIIQFLKQIRFGFKWEKMAIVVCIALI